MAKKKEVTPKKLSSYEEDCIWMSYRYCIGRHTIASHMHAGEIASNAYHRLSKERMLFMAKDILEEIHQKLHFIGISCDVSIKYNNADFILIEKLFEFYNENKLRDDFKTLTGLRYEADGTWTEKHLKKDDLPIICIFDIYRLGDIEDLMVWYKLAKCFMNTKYKTFITKDDEEIVYFECYEKFIDTDRTTVYKKIMVPLDKYLENPHVTVYLDPDFEKKTI